MRSRRGYIWILLIALLVTCGSCRQELCYDHFPAMDLHFAWEQEWERDYGMNHIGNWDPDVHHYRYDDLRPSVPEWVKMVKYYNDGRMVEKLFSPEGEKFEVPANDSCSMLFYNGDTEYIILSDLASLQDARATSTTRTRSGSSLKDMQELYGTTRTTNSPDVIYASYAENASTVDVHEVLPLHVKMQPLVYTYLITFEFEEGLEYVSQARGALGGMAEGVYLRTGTTTDEICIILFDCDVQSDACRCQVRSFGVPSFPDSHYGKSAGDDEKPFTLHLEVRLKSGRTQNLSFDITDQIKNQPRGGVIKVGGIKVKDEGGSSGGDGFDVGVSDWEDDEIDLEF